MTKPLAAYDSDPAFESIIRELNSLQSPTLLLLRGHLLIETLLRRFLESRSKNPSAVNDARLTFSQLLCLVQSRFKKGTAARLWRQLREINRMRNTLAHQLDQSDFNNQWRTFVGRFQKEFPYLGEKTEIDALRKLLLSTARLLGDSLIRLENEESSKVKTDP